MTNVQAAAGAEYAFNTLGAKTSYLLIDKGMEYTLLLGQYFKDRYTELGGEIVHGGYLPDRRQGLFGADHEAEGIGHDAGHAVHFRRSGRCRHDHQAVPRCRYGRTDHGWRRVRHTTLLDRDRRCDGADNVYFTTHSLIDAELGSDVVKQFMAAYESEYGTAPENAFAGLGYDTAKLLADAIAEGRVGRSRCCAYCVGRDEGLPWRDWFDHVSRRECRFRRRALRSFWYMGGKFTLAAEVVPEKVPAP